MDRSGKAAIIEAFKANAEKASFAAITNFKGMTVEELTNLRVNIRKAGGEYHVIKNTLGRIAVTGTSHEVIKDNFHENTGVALGYEDPVAVAKCITDFAKGSQRFEVKSASLQGKEMNTAQVEALAKLPGREQLLAQMLGTLNAVPTNFVSLFANMLRGLLYALNGIKEQKEGKAE